MTITSIDFQGAQVQLVPKSKMVIFNEKMNDLDTWVLDKFFPNKMGLPLADPVNDKRVYIGALETHSVIAPLVAPSVQGRVIEDKADYKASYVTPPYLKPSHMLMPSNVTNITILENLKSSGIVANTQTNASKIRAAQVYNYMRRQASITNFKVVQALDILLKGKTTFISVDFPEVTVDYGRHADMTFTPAVTWDDVNAPALDDIKAMDAAMVEHEGTSPSMVLTTSKVISKLKKNKQFLDEFVTPYGANAQNPFIASASVGNAPKFHGVVDGVEYWTWDKKYKENGVMKRYIPEDGFYMIADMSGFQVACGLVNMDVLNEPLDSYTYVSPNTDPIGYKEITDASPLIVPSMVNGVVGGTGFVA